MSEQPADDEVLPRRSPDDTDAGWGEDQTVDPDDDRRYTDDRPPHWEP